VFCVAVTNRKIRTEFGDADLANGFENAKSLEYGHVHRQKGLADVKTRVTIFFQQCYVPTFPGGDAAESRARRSAADDQYVSPLYCHGVVARAQLAN
jgi:hypothetical protein